ASRVGELGAGAACGRDRAAALTAAQHARPPHLAKQIAVIEEIDGAAAGEHDLPGLAVGVVLRGGVAAERVSDGGDVERGDVADVASDRRARPGACLRRRTEGAHRGHQPLAAAPVDRQATTGAKAGAGGAGPGPAAAQRAGAAVPVGAAARVVRLVEVEDGLARAARAGRVELEPDGAVIDLDAIGLAGSGGRVGEGRELAVLGVLDAGEIAVGVAVDLTKLAAEHYRGQRPGAVRV